MKSLLDRFRTPPDCREVAEVLQAFLDGELPEERAHVVADHLDHCDRCGIDADTYQRVKDSLAGLRVPPDRDAVARLRAFGEDLPSRDEG